MDVVSTKLPNCSSRSQKTSRKSTTEIRVNVATSSRDQSRESYHSHRSNWSVVRFFIPRNIFSMRLMKRGMGEELFSAENCFIEKSRLSRNGVFRYFDSCA